MSNALLLFPTSSFSEHRTAPTASSTISRLNEHLVKPANNIEKSVFPNISNSSFHSSSDHDIGRDRASSCTKSTLKSSSNACVAHAVEALKNFDRLAVDTGNGIPFAEAAQGATRIMARLQEEITRLAVDREKEDHIKAILQAKIDVLNARHRKAIADATAEEQALARDQLENGERMVKTIKMENSIIDDLLRNHLSLMENKRNQSISKQCQLKILLEKLTDEAAKKQSADEENVQKEHELGLAGIKRSELRKVCDEAGLHLKTTTRNCAAMVRQFLLCFYLTSRLAAHNPPPPITGRHGKQTLASSPDGTSASSCTQGTRILSVSSARK